MEDQEFKAAVAALLRDGYQFRQMVEGAWQLLPDEEREVLMRRHAGETLSSLASERGLSVERVRTIQSKAGRRLARLMHDEAQRPLIESMKASHEEDPAGGHWRSIPIRELRLPERAKNGLRANSCQTIGDVVEVGARQLRRSRNLGKVSMQQIESAMEAQGVDLKNEGFYDSK